MLACPARVGARLAPPTDSRALDDWIRRYIRAAWQRTEGSGDEALLNRSTGLAAVLEVLQCFRQQEASVRDGGRRRLGVSDLARRRAARQCLDANQALARLLFLYKDVLNVQLGSVPPVVRARTPERLPVVLSRDEVAAL
jgi:hypothetical protein